MTYIHEKTIKEKISYFCVVTLNACQALRGKVDNFDILSKITISKHLNLFAVGLHVTEEYKHDLNSFIFHNRIITVIGLAWAQIDT